MFQEIFERKRWRALILSGLCLLLAACGSLPPQGMRGAEFIASPNFNERRPNLVVLHHTSNNNLQDSLLTLQSPVLKVSAHYLIGRDGRIIQLVDETKRAWHAGVSWWGGDSDINSSSIGIELDNNGQEPFPPEQVSALLDLLADLQQRYRIPKANFIGHGDVAPGRKVDPSAWFPWDVLALNGYGLWCEPPFPDAPPGFDLQLGLTALGYNPATPQASLNAFLLHFSRGATLDNRQQKALAHCLLQQKTQRQG